MYNFIIDLAMPDVNKLGLSTDLFNYNYSRIDMYSVGGVPMA